jgi:mono/diheme cytochrome c family protein
VESPPADTRSRRHALLVVGVTVLALAAAGCGALGYTSGNGDKTNGKKLFLNGAKGKASCGSCHTLADAGTTGTIGPNLDAAFAQALKVGMTEDTIRQVIRGQISYAVDQPSTGAPGMPKNLVTGRDARDVAAYVASAVVKDTAGGTTAPAPGPTPAPTPAATPPPSGGGGGGGGSSAAGDAAAGKKVFLGAGGCSACHALADAGSTATVGPKLENVAADAKKAGKAVDAYVKESIVDPNAYIAPGFPKGVMPPDFKSTLSAKQIADLVAYIVSATGS